MVQDWPPGTAAAQLQYTNIKTRSEFLLLQMSKCLSFVPSRCASLSLSTESENTLPRLLRQRTPARSHAMKLTQDPAVMSLWLQGVY